METAWPLKGLGYGQIPALPTINGDPGRTAQNFVSARALEKSVNRLGRIRARHEEAVRLNRKTNVGSERPKNRWSRCGQEWYDIGVRGDVMRGRVDRRFRIRIVGVQEAGSGSRGKEEEKLKLLYTSVYIRFSVDELPAINKVK